MKRKKHSAQHSPRAGEHGAPHQSKTQAGACITLAHVSHTASHCHCHSSMPLHNLTYRRREAHAGHAAKQPRTDHHGQSTVPGLCRTLQVPKAARLVPPPPNQPSPIVQTALRLAVQDMQSQWQHPQGGSPGQPASRLAIYHYTRFTLASVHCRIS